MAPGRQYLNVVEIWGVSSWILRVILCDQCVFVVIFDLCINLHFPSFREKIAGIVNWG